MSQYRCHACDVPITSLTSQKNGNLDTCLSCAIEHASFVRYTLKRRTELIDDVILCQQHYQDDKAVLLQPLTEREQAAGMVATLAPYSGIYECRVCADVKEQAEGVGQ